MEKTCPCGKQYFCPDRLIERKKYCCKKCFYKFRTRPSGLKYVLVKENPTSFKTGFIPWNKGTRGIMPNPWNKNTKGLVKPNSGNFTSERMSEELHPKWKGSNVGYFALHSWVSRKKGKAKVCSECKGTQNVQWANLSHEYKRDLDDFIEMCNKCHAHYDVLHWGVATRKFNL